EFRRVLFRSGHPQHSGGIAPVDAHGDIARGESRARGGRRDRHRAPFRTLRHDTTISPGGSDSLRTRCAARQSADRTEGDGPTWLIRALTGYIESTSGSSTR